MSVDLTVFVISFIMMARPWRLLFTWLSPVQLIFGNWSRRGMLLLRRKRPVCLSVIISEFT